MMNIEIPWAIELNLICIFAARFLSRRLERRERIHCSSVFCFDHFAFYWIITELQSFLCSGVGLWPIDSTFDPI